jgi:hypothetical protein
MTASRGAYTGVLKILQYNLHSYIASVCAMLGIGVLLWLRLLPPAGGALLIGVAALTAFWTLSSLFASYYVYDYAGVTRWHWLPAALMFPPRQWLNIHAGLDESTQILTQLFPDTGYAVLDIYDRREMT